MGRGICTWAILLGALAFLFSDLATQMCQPCFREEFDFGLGLWVKGVGEWFAWENSQHFAIPPLVSASNEFWGTSAGIPYWWRVANQIWVVPLISWSGSWSKIPSRHDQSESLVTRHQYGISALVPRTSFRVETCNLPRRVRHAGKERVHLCGRLGNQWCRREMSAVFLG